MSEHAIKASDNKADLDAFAASYTSRTQNGTQIVMSTFAQASREEKIISSFQRL